MTTSALHQPVLLTEACDALDIKKDHLYLDGTFGRGGHTREILARGGRVVAFDVDQTAIDYGQKEFLTEIKDSRLILIRENFAKLAETLADQGITQVSGALFDFGTSADQLKSDQRGFSFEHDSPLDMRMDDRLGVQAKDLLAVLSEQQLRYLFWEFGGEEKSRGIAKNIVHARETEPITTTGQLIKIIEKVKRYRGHERIHPATKVFQALRIAVNMEMDVITQVMPQVFKLIAPGGRLVLISFHEGEDRIAKDTLKTWQLEQKGEMLTKKPVKPSEQEIINNPRSRSAKLRAFKKN